MTFTESAAIIPTERRDSGDVSQIHSPFPAISPSAPYDLIDTKFTQTLALANDMIDKLQGVDGNSGYLGTLNSLIAAYSLPVTPDLVVDIDTDSVGVTVGAAPSTLPTASLSDLPTAPAAFTTPAPVSSVDAVSISLNTVGVTVDPVSATAPVADLSDIPLAPAPFSGTPPSAALDGLVTEFDTFDVAAPTPIAMPTVDTSSLSLVSAPDELTGVTINWSEVSLNNAVYPTLLARLLADLESGATGLDATVEQEIYDRALARQVIENDKRTDEIDALYSGSRWDAPSGAYIAAQAELSSDIGRNNADLNGKIMIEQADLAQKNSQFIITQAVALEKMFRDTRDSESNRLLDKEKAQAVNTIQVYAERVKAYVAEMEASKIFIDAQVAALNGAVEYNKGLFEVFSAQAGVYSTVVGAQSKVNDSIIGAYAAKIQGFTAEIQAYETKIKSYGVEMQGYATEISKYEADLKGYESALRGYETYNKAIADNQMVLVENNKALIAKADTELKSSIAENDASVKIFEAEVSGYDTKMKGYGIAMDGYGVEVKKYEADLAGFDSSVKGYEAYNKAVGANQLAIVENNKAMISKAEVELRAIIAKIDATLKGYESEMALRERVSKDMADIASQAVASALSSTNVSASMGYSGSEGRSESFSHSENVSQSDSFSSSVSESHSYEHDPSA